MPRLNLTEEELAESDAANAKHAAAVREQEINDLFRSHPLDRAQQMHVDFIRRRAQGLAQSIDTHCPKSADRSAAMRLLQDAASAAIRSIAHRGKSYR